MSVDMNIDFTNHSYDRNTCNADADEKSSAVWTYSATRTLLRLYEIKLELLETPKKKTKIWMSISDALKNYNIKVTPNQVRWKINALTKKYKQCLNTRQYIRFKYFREMDKIYSHHNVDCDTFHYRNDVIMYKRKLCKPDADDRNYMSLNGECKAMIELRKLRLANRIECERTQSKINLEKQWLEYLKIEEQNSLLQDELCIRNLKIREEEIELQREEIKFLESLEIKRIQLKEKQQAELLRIEKEKCDLLLGMITDKNVML